MELQLSVFIDQPRSEVFEFMKDMRNHPQEVNSKVLRVVKITPGEIATGAQFQERVRMFPFLNAKFINEITRFESNEQIEITWHGGWMEGVLRLQFENLENGTLMKLQETITPRGVMKLFGSVIGQNFIDTWEKRLKGIQYFLEMGVLQ